MEIDKRKKTVLRTVILVVVILAAAGVILLALRLFHRGVDTSKGLERLKEMESVDVTAVDQKIQELEAAERAADEEWASRSANEKFANSLVLGDSIAQGLYEYGVLDSSHVLAERGAGLVNGGGELAASQIAQAKSLAPQALFLSYGMNDMNVTDQESFLAAYRQALEDLKESLPDTAIYVNSILPVQQDTAAEQPAYANIPQYNEGLKSLCDELGITFIDNTDLVKEEYYADDGIHMAPAYYTEWVNRMAEVAGL
nr:GDSL-type esterase/lipase family protein [uncultured Merdimonas sp.]